MDEQSPSRYSASLFRVLAEQAAIDKRCSEFRLLANLANNRTKEIDILRKIVVGIFRKHTNLSTMAGWEVLRAPGFAIQPHGERGPICWEAPVGITLSLAEEPILGLGLELRGKVLCIRQLQGIKGKHLGKHLQQWPQLFVEACMVLAHVRGFETVRLYRADQSFFYEYPDIKLDERDQGKSDLKAHRERMRRRYDGTARQMGFKMKKNWGEWTNPNYKRQ